MKAIKYKLLVILALASFYVVGLPQPASAAITKAQQQACLDKYDGHGIGNGTDGKLTPSLQRQYNDSKCDTSKGGNCRINSSSQGAIIGCTDPSPSASNNPDSNLSSDGLGGVRNPNDCKAASFDTLNKNNCDIIKWILIFTNVMSGVAGTVIVGMIILGGIQYSMAGSDPSKVQAARKKITNALLALVLFVFGFAFLQWIVPGGLI